ncbi:unnamed protein product [Peronospora belbahrii]|uniref:Uncharacterized protein n=1 Tax=Peronospora belbahrii TaxID=622444 RepID=A0AAU9KPS4_9STRA|nr:unnamed protein product [Peronospora belbahrii]CAH0520776.1 unnamed protein product [Peronospora belbahrii]
MMKATSVTINTDSVGGSTAAAAPPKRSFIQKVNDVNKMELPKLLRYMRLGTLVSIYVIMFGILFLLFECRLSRMETAIRSNFGFLYSYKGRAAFIFFIGFLDFGIGSALATLAGFLMCFNAFINLLVMCRHPEFKSTLSANADPTAGYTTSNQEAVSFMSKNPELALKAGQYAFQQAAHTRH